MKLIKIRDLEANLHFINIDHIVSFSKSKGHTVIHTLTHEIETDMTIENILLVIEEMV